MTYIPTQWNTGDIVTAEKLNKLEIGVARGNGIVPSIVNSETDEITIDRSFDDLTELVANGTLPFLALEVNNNGIILAPLQHLVYADNYYIAGFKEPNEMITFVCSRPDIPMSTTPDDEIK